MTKEQQLVKEWMQKFGQETPEKPIMPDLATRKLRAKLILEEALECIEALGFSVKYDSYFKVGEHNLYHEYNPNLELLADGLADLHYVAYCGTALACGIDMEPIFEEVHRSNMSKFWSTNDLRKDANWPDDLEGCSTAVNEGKYIAERIGPITTMDTPAWIVKDKDGKVIKSPSYSPINIKPLLENQK